MSSELEDRLRQAAEILPFPDEQATRRAQELARASVRHARRRRLPTGPFWRIRVRWAAAVAAAVVVASGLAVGVGAWSSREESTKTSLVGLGFLPAKGWMVVQSGQSGSASAIAANVPLRADNDVQAAVRATRASLPAKGVLMVVSFTTRGDSAADVGFTRRDLPLSLASGLASFSGNQRVYRIRAGVGSYNLDARIYFGSASPTRETMEVAQRQLNRLVVASERVTIFARPTILARGQVGTLLGSVESDNANEVVTIEGKECGPQAASFRPLGTFRTRSGGGWSAPISVVTTTAFRATWADAVSAPATVWVRAAVFLHSRGSAHQFEVRVGGQANFWRKSADIQRYNSRLGTWARVRSVVLTESRGAYAAAKFTMRVPRRTLIRAVFPRSQARPCHLAGYSDQLRT